MLYGLNREISVSLVAGGHAKTKKSRVTALVD